MIPRTLHQLWFSNNTLHKKCWRWRQSFLQFGPDWNMKLWTIDDMLLMPMPGEMREVLEHPDVHYTLKTDVGRFVPLFIEGGVYADTDMECLRPLYDLLETKSFAGQGRAPDAMGNAIIGCVPGCKLMLEIGTVIAKNILENVELANHTVVDAGVRVAGRMLDQVATIYPVEAFYPYSWQQKKNKQIPAFESYSKTSYCVHHWTGLDEGGWVGETITRPNKGTTIKPDRSKRDLPPRVNQYDFLKTVSGYLEGMGAGWRMIPKVIHRIWLGTNPLPDEVKGYLDGQQKICKGYAWQVWTDKTISEIRDFMLPSSWTMLQDDCLTPVIKSDILRYELLRLFGGIYLDTDVEVIRPFDELLNIPFFCGWESGEKIGTAIIGSIPFHPICRTMSDKIYTNYCQSGPPQSAYQQLVFGGPYLFTDVLAEFKTVCPFPRGFFFPHQKPEIPTAIHFFVGGQTKAGWTHQMKEPNTCDHPVE
jgi:mannosyltransferase OCH1-like enzyme